MMSKIKTALLLLLLNPLAYMAKESLPEYSVGKTSPDKTLKKTESLFVINFSERGTAIANELITFSYNGTDKKMTTDAKGNVSIKVKPGKYKFQFFHSSNYYEITTDSIPVKPGFRLPVFVYFVSAKYPVMAEKPVIYVYAPDTTDVTVKLTTKNKFSFTYPEYKDAWSVKATPNGDLVAGKYVYPYLFWEGNIELPSSDINTSEGFVVSNDKLITFFEEKLTAMGLNQKEQADFITYWCPRMNMHEKSYVHFLFNEEIKKYADLKMEPTPSSVFRVYMVWTPADEIKLVEDLREQKIPIVKRAGLTLIEWGGAELDLLKP